MRISYWSSDVCSSDLATLASEAIFEAYWSDDRADMFYHSSSYTANPIACAAASANLAIWREEDVLGCIASLSQSIATHMGTLSSHPAFENGRQIGAIAALAIRSEERRVGQEGVSK